MMTFIADTGSIEVSCIGLGIEVFRGHSIVGYG